MRRPDWISRLRAAIDFQRDLRYRPGWHDCALFTAWNADRISVGTDYFARTQAMYRPGNGVTRETLERGVDLELLATQVVGRLPVCMGFIGRGDAVLVRDGDRQVLGTSLGDKIATVAPGSGLALYPCELGVMGWRIQ